MDTTTGNTSEMSRREATIWFWSVALGFVGLWVLLPYLFHTGYKVDVVELQLIGKEWVLATRKHPMLPAWILETFNLLTGRSFLAPYLATALCTLVTLFSVWRLARKVLSERLAFIGTFCMLPFWSITVESIEFNQNTALMACWALTILMFHNAFQTNKKRWWIAAGLTLGLGLHAKYTMILLAIAVLLYSLWRFRRYWKESGPWLTVAISFAIFLPHLFWLYYAGFWTTIDYAAGRQQYHPGLTAHFVAPVKFAVCQFGLIALSPLLLLIPSLGWKWKKRSLQSEMEEQTLQYLFCCVFFPFLMFFFFAAATGINTIAAYGYTLWFFLGVYLLLQFQRQDEADVFRRTFWWTFLAVFAMVMIFIVQAIGSPYLMGTARQFHFPMKELGEKCDRVWTDRFADLPCPYTTGNWWHAGNAAYAMKDRPSVLFYYGGIETPNTLPTGTWATDDDVNQHGGIILWGESGEPVPDWVHRRFPNADVLPEILEVPYKTRATIPPLKLRMAIVPPQMP